MNNRLEPIRGGHDSLLKFSFRGGTTKPPGAWGDLSLTPDARGVPRRIFPLREKPRAPVRIRGRPFRKFLIRDGTNKHKSLSGLITTERTGSNVAPSAVINPDGGWVIRIK